MFASPFPTPSLRLALVLDDGRAVVARPVRPDDRERLRLGFEELSDRSKQLRFFSALQSLSEAELRYLTEVDHVHHAAWGLILPEDDAADESRPGIGVGRFVRLPQSPDAAEYSLTVLDVWQGTGAGRLLLALLVEHARRVGVRTLCGLVEENNEPVLRWMRRLGQRGRHTADGVLFHLPTDPEAWSTEASSARHLADAVEGIRDAWTEALEAKSQDTAPADGLPPSDSQSQKDA